MKEFINLKTEFRTGTKGRKRRCFIKSKNMYEFLNEEVLPEWTLMLRNISCRERQLGIIHKGQEYAWEEFFKDVRKFYRLIFKLRFHRCDKRKDSNRGKLVQTVLEDLGINEVDYNIDEVFEFFYPILQKLRKDVQINETDIGSLTFTKIYHSYSKENCIEFYQHKVGLKLLKFFMFNYAELYKKHMKRSFKKEILEVLNNLADQLT